MCFKFSHVIFYKSYLDLLWFEAYKIFPLLCFLLNTKVIEAVMVASPYSIAPPDCSNQFQITGYAHNMDCKMQISVNSTLKSYLHLVFLSIWTYVNLAKPYPPKLLFYLIICHYWDLLFWEYVQYILISRHQNITNYNCENMAKIFDKPHRVLQEEASYRQRIFNSESHLFMGRIFNGESHLFMSENL